MSRETGSAFDIDHHHGLLLIFPPEIGSLYEVMNPIASSPAPRLSDGNGPGIPNALGSTSLSQGPALPPRNSRTSSVSSAGKEQLWRAGDWGSGSSSYSISEN